MIDQQDHASIAYQGLAAVAGSITALSMLKWREMSWPEVFMTMFVGTSFSIFAVPWLAADLAGIDMGSLRVVCGITYIGATGANILIPMAIRRARAVIGLEDKA